MKHLLPKLAFSPDALTPFVSEETLAYHHGKHHAGYVEKLNGLVASTDLQDLSLTELVQRATGPVFNNAAQHYNHSFYWRCITPGDGKQPSGELLQAIERDFGSMAKLKEAFTSAAKTHFGSGWCWLVEDSAGRLRVRTSDNAGCPLVDGEAPLLTCDVWEHAYYIDHRNDRARYVDLFWSAANWDFAALALATPTDVEKLILA